MEEVQDETRQTQWHRPLAWLLTGALLLAFLAIADRLLPANKQVGNRYLLIHADDAGLSASANRATIAGMERGVITSASIMVPCPGFEEIADYARRNAEADFGLHITLTSEWDGVRWGPVSELQRVSSLVDADGMFYRRAEQFAKHAAIDEVATEVRAQINRALDRGIELTHLDSHMNTLFRRPDLIALFVEISREFQLPIRYPRQLPPGWETQLTKEVKAAYFLHLKTLYSRQNPLVDFIELKNYSVEASDKRAYFLKTLRDLEPGVTEIVIHCWDENADGWSPPDADRRAADAVTFLSPEVAREIDALGIQLIDWRDFSDMAREDSKLH